MAEIRLECVSPEDAQKVAAEADMPGSSQRATADGSFVVLEYFDKRYPMHVADWAFKAGYASDRAAADVIARLLWPTCAR